MKKKIYVIKAAALILGTMIIASASAQTIQSDNNIHKGDLIAEESTIPKENIKTFEHESLCFGSISGGTFWVHGPMVVSPILCIVLVYSKEAKIFRPCISFGSYTVKRLPVGYTYTVTAGPLTTSPLTETVTLTPDEPHARVDFVFY